MSKVITFSRVFPAYHPRNGQPTFFVEKFLHSVYTDFGQELNTYLYDCKDKIGLQIINILDVDPKYHTIRSGSRWKVGDKFSPRVWSGKPYQSKQVIIAPDIEIKKIWKFEIKGNGFYINDWPISPDKLCDVAENDGLDYFDFQRWFQYPKPFSGQIICWDESIEY
jgi:hypothetical protein